MEIGGFKVFLHAELPSSIKMIEKNPPLNHSDNTSSREGLDLSSAKAIWTETAATLCRVNLVRQLLSENLGFREVEDYNQALDLKLRSEKLKTRRENGKSDRGIVREIMGKKLNDANNCYREALLIQNRTRQEIDEKTGKNSSKSRNILKKLRSEAAKVRKEIEEKYNSKIEHLRNKFGDKREKTSLGAPV